jgi:hypothetical protein
MSAVRMCDRCTKIFPYEEEGSCVLSGTKNRRYSDGNRYTENVTLDICANCNNDMNGEPKVPTLPSILPAASLGNDTP